MACFENIWGNLHLVPHAERGVYHHLDVLCHKLFTAQHGACILPVGVEAAARSCCNHGHMHASLSEVHAHHCKEGDRGGVDDVQSRYTHTVLVP